MQPANDQFLPAADVRLARLDDAAVLTSASADVTVQLTSTAEQVWTLLQQGSSRTLDRLVMSMARRSSGQALAQVPDVVVTVLDDLISRGFVHRVAA